jgi:hypothetical protein
MCRWGFFLKDEVERLSLLAISMMAVLLIREKASCSQRF